MKNYLLISLLLVSTITFLVVACSKSSADTYGGGNNNTCDTSAVKYSADIVPILQTSCYSCHGSGTTSGSGGIDLSSYSRLKVYADNGYLVGNVTHAPGYVGMPYGLPKLPDCQVNKISAWVHQGAQNN